jgi:Ran GTPase-activating protein (RanGAP) involved in mRNA processing and transport
MPEKYDTIIYLRELNPLLPRIHISQTSLANTYQNKQLQQLIQKSQLRSTVNLYKQNLINEDMEIVVQEAIINKQCKTLILSWNKITSVGASIIAEALNHNTTLEKLHLNGNHLSDTGVHSLTKTLALNNSKLQTLDLQSTGIKDEGAKHLTKMLKINTTLTGLLVGGNDISNRGIELLANALTYHNDTLLDLYLDRNKPENDLRADSLVEMLQKNRTLKTLCIYMCNLPDNEKEKLRDIAQSKNGFELDV